MVTRKKTKHTTTKNHQLVKKERKELQNNKRAINKRDNKSIPFRITINVNGLNSPIKRHRVSRHSNKT